MSSDGERKPRIAVIDLFAGSGASVRALNQFKDRRGTHPFELCLSVEKDPHARATLLLRSFFRQFPNTGA
jgi:DNA (cytosine-5)-methyltransferase 1